MSSSRHYHVHYFNQHQLSLLVVVLFCFLAHSPVPTAGDAIARRPPVPPPVPTSPHSSTTEREQTLHKFSEHLRNLALSKSGPNLETKEFAPDVRDTAKHQPTRLRRQVVDKIGLGEMLVTATTETMVHPRFGRQYVLMFQVPDSIDQDSIYEATIHYNEFAFAHATTSKDSVYLDPYPFKDNSRITVTMQHSTLCCLPTTLIHNIRSLLFASTHFQNNFKLRFLLVKEIANTNITEFWPLVPFPEKPKPEKYERAVQPYLRLRYSSPPQNAPANINKQGAQGPTDCGSLPLFEECCLVRSQVRLDEIDWDKTFTSPKIIRFNYCRGSCTSNSAAKTMNAHIRRTILDRQIVRSFDWRDFQMCCAPVEYETLIMHRKMPNHPNVTVVETLPDAVVTRCGCV